ncbi:MAG TPA: sulfite exporter TauE/SafE family protein [Acidimicrobiales bacterium]|nr:sulfite exporter TauE/SafE family protein [Acidimicrobiales bacterium]
MTAAEIVLIAVAGFLAGGVNAVAGGGSLISFPALVAAGLPTLAANVTNTVAVWPGYLGSAAAYRSELRDQGHRLRALAVTSVLGAAAGAAILLVAPDAVFDAVVPFLVLAGSVLLALQPRIAKAVLARTAAGAGGQTVQLHVAIFLAAVYGAYFGGGLGVILLAVLGIFVADHLQRLNGLKAAISLLINTVALVAFALFGPVDWAAVAIVAPASLLGGYVGGRLARRLSPDALRTTIVVFGVVVAIWLALR